MEKMNSNSMDDSRNLQCYVAKEDTPLIRVSGSCDVNVTTLHSGTLVETVEDSKDDTLIIHVIDIVKSEPDIWYNTQWRCHRFFLIPISAEVKQFFLAIQEYEDRTRLAKDVELCKELQNVRIDHTVWYYPDPYEHSEKLYLALVKYIGPVPKLGKGHYFGLDLLEHPDLCTKTVNHLVQRYFKCTYSAGIFCTLNKIRVFKKELTSGSTEKISIPQNEVRNTMEQYNAEDKFKTILDSNIATLEKCTIFDDRKNNNREPTLLPKDWHQSSKPTTRNYIDNYMKSVESSNVAQTGNELFKVNKINDSHMIFKHSN